MREEDRSVQRVINALIRRGAVETISLIDGLIALAAWHSQPRKAVVPKSKIGPQSIDI
jgi:hypothetical protein